MIEFAPVTTDHKPLVFSGMQPTNTLHLGNYLGALRNWVKMQDLMPCIYCVVDMHAITVAHDPKKLSDATREVAAAYIAAGVDPKRSILFNQSQVAAHAELAWVFSCVARMGWLNRMTQFKEKAGKNRENSSVGLFIYPNLMAADILAYRATHVPVGEDQKQHLELTRDIAQKFNLDFGAPDFFPLPEPVIVGPGTRVMSLRDGTKKMSKSDESEYSRINLTDDADTMRLKIRKANTDPQPLPGPEILADPASQEARSEAMNLLGIYAALADRPLEEVLAEHAGSEFSRFKEVLSDLLIATIGEIGREVKRLNDNPAAIDAVLRQGVAAARRISEPILREIHDIVGFLRP